MPVGVLAAVGGRVVAVLVQFLVQKEFEVPALVVGRNLVPVHAAGRKEKTITTQVLLLSTGDSLIRENVACYS